MKKFLPILILITLVLPVVVTLAQQVTTPELPEVSVLDTIEKVATLLFWVLLAVSIVFIVFAGILFVTAAGSPEKVEQARHIILYAIIGIIVAILAYGIRAFLLTHLG